MIKTTAAGDIGSNIIVSTYLNGTLQESATAAKGMNGRNNTYILSDGTFTNGNYLYHFKLVDNNGAVSLTNIIAVAFAGKKDVLIYPAILSHGQQLWIKTTTASVFTISVFDIQGKMVKQERKVSDGFTTINTIGLAAGTYVLKMLAADGNVTQLRFIVN